MCREKMKVDIRLGRMLYCATPPATNNNSGKMFPKILFFCPEKVLMSGMSYVSLVVS